jgi:uncharacterized protein YndB with AHSA1/START domain
MSRDETLIYEVRLDEPPALVWRALTEPGLLARWLGDSDFDAHVGRRFQLRPGGAAGAGPVEGEVIEAETERLLSYRWRADTSGPAPLDTVVTWILEPTAEGGTRLRMVHDGFPIVVESPAAARTAEVASLSLHRARRARVHSCSQGSLKWAA